MTNQYIEQSNQETKQVHKQSNRFSKDYFNFFKNSILFLLFALFNGIMPIAIVLLVSNTDNMNVTAEFWKGIQVGYGTQAAMSIGYLAAVQIGFIQISWSLSIATIYAFNRSIIAGEGALLSKEQIFAKLYKNSMKAITIYNVIFTPVCVAVCAIYNEVACLHQNTLLGQTEAFWYILGSLIYDFILSYLFTFIVFVQYKKSSFLAIILMILSFALIGGSMAVGAFLPDILIKINATKFNKFIQKDLHIGLYAGLGLSIGTLVSLLIVAPIAMIVINPTSKLMKSEKGNQAWEYMRYSWRQLTAIATIQLFKGFAIIGIAIKMSSTIDQVISLNYQMGRTVWYILLYILPFFGYGFADAITFFGLTDTKVTAKNLLWIVGITISVTFLLQIALSFALYIFLYDNTTVNKNIGLINFLVANNTHSGQTVIQQIAGNPKELSKLDLQYLLTTMLKKQEYLDQVKMLSNPKMLEAFLTQNGIPAALAPKLSAALAPMFQGMVDPATRQQSIVKLVQFLETFGVPPALPKGALALKVKQMLLNKLSTLSSASVFGMFKMNFSSANGYQDFNITYLYLTIWTSLYPLGVMLNNTKMVLRKSQMNLFEFIFTVTIQAAMISFIVGFGIAMQYDAGLELYNAWSLILGIMGPIAFIYYTIRLCQTTSSYKKYSYLMSDDTIASFDPARVELMKNYV